MFSFSSSWSLSAESLSSCPPSWPSYPRQHKSIQLTVNTTSLELLFVYLPFLLPFLLSLGFGLCLFLHLSLPLPLVMLPLLHLFLLDLAVSDDFCQRVMKQLVILQ